MIIFKDYYGNAIKIPEHKHVLSDTKDGNNTAYATTTNNGFMAKEDVQKMQSLSYQLAVIDNLVDDISQN